MNFLEQCRPTNFDQILGNKAAIKSLIDAQLDSRSVILYGSPGIGKTSIARAYFNQQYTEYAGAGLATEDIRCMRGNVVINEINTLDKRKMAQLLTPIETQRITLVGTTTAPLNALSKELLSRCVKIKIEYPDDETIQDYVTLRLRIAGKSISPEQVENINRASVNDLRYLNTYIYLLMQSTESEISDEYLQQVLGTPMSMGDLEELKSAMQKSIRGSDPDAASLYALFLLDCGFLEEVVRRLRVIASEDIGLASTSCVSLVNACLDNALHLGMPEARFPILHAVVYMAIQPKSNSLHTIIDRYKELGISNLVPPDNIRYVHSKTYKYPHDYINNWVPQNYMPTGLEKLRLYTPGNNKTEQMFKDYWDKVKKGSN